MITYKKVFPANFILYIKQMLRILRSIDESNVGQILCKIKPYISARETINGKNAAITLLRNFDFINGCIVLRCQPKKLHILYQRQPIFTLNYIQNILNTMYRSRVKNRIMVGFGTG